MDYTRETGITLNNRLKLKIYGKIREVAKYAPAVIETLQLAVHPTEKGPRGGSLFVCNHCGLCFKRKEVQVDHKKPVIPTDSSIEEMDFNTIISNLFCSPNNLQVLCKPCHQIKCNDENAER